MAYDPYSTDDGPVAMKKAMPDPDSIENYMGESNDFTSGPQTDEPMYKARYGPGGMSMSRPVPVVPDTEEQLEDWLRQLYQQDEALQAEHTETLDAISAQNYKRATLEARITTVANTTKTVTKILEDHRRQMARAGDELENRRGVR